MFTREQAFHELSEFPEFAARVIREAGAFIGFGKDNPDGVDRVTNVRSYCELMTFVPTRVGANTADEKSEAATMLHFLLRTSIHSDFGIEWYFPGYNGKEEHFWIADAEKLDTAIQRLEGDHKTAQQHSSKEQA